MFLNKKTAVYILVKYNKTAMYILVKYNIAMGIEENRMGVNDLINARPISKLCNECPSYFHTQQSCN